MAKYEVLFGYVLMEERHSGSGIRTCTAWEKSRRLVCPFAVQQSQSLNLQDDRKGLWKKVTSCRKYRKC